jgi:hypothetical protein
MLITEYDRDMGIPVITVKRIKCVLLLSVLFLFCIKQKPLEAQFLSANDVEVIDPNLSLLIVSEDETYVSLTVKEGREYKISDIAHLTGLKRLYIRVPVNTRLDLQGIENFSLLEELIIQRQTYIVGEIFNVEGIGKLANLRILHILYTGWPLDILRDMPNLVVLTLDNVDYYYPDEDPNPTPYQVLDVSPLATLPKLTYLHAERFILRNIAALDALGGKPTIYFYGCRLYDETDESRHFIWFGRDSK